MLRELQYELQRTNAKVEEQDFLIEMLRLKVGKYYAYHMHKWELGHKIDKQIKENEYAIQRIFGTAWMMDSLIEKAAFRTLEDMRDEKIITEQEYSVVERV